jgi:hypothetical protein
LTRACSTAGRWKPIRTSHPVLYEINVWPWLGRLSRRDARTVTLGSIPASEWDRLAALGVELVYLMGLWHRSPISRGIARSDAGLFAAYDRGLPAWQAVDVVGSAFSLIAYEVDPHLGRDEDLACVRDALHARGLRLIVDFVPNHTAFDHPWVAAHPDRYVCVPEEVFRANPRAYRPVELPGGDVRFVACGRDPFFPPWSDVAQLDHFRPETRAAMLGELQRIAARADGARCDMAMLLLSDVFSRTWGGMSGSAPPPSEFWADAVATLPGFELIAEVYWDLEWRLQQLGFRYTYDKAFYDRLVRGDGPAVHGHLCADPAYQRRSARFIENHDEPRSVAAFGDRVRAAAVASTTVPGLRCLYDGQLEGRRLRLPVQLGRLPDEPPDGSLRAFYERLLGVVASPAFHDGDWRLLECRSAGDGTWPGLVAWRWAHRGELWVVAVNVAAGPAQGCVQLLPDLPAGDHFAFEDVLDGRVYSWERQALVRSGGLYVRLESGRAHLLRVS